jgi:RNA-directed DNA polymerase
MKIKLKHRKLKRKQFIKVEKFNIGMDMVECHRWLENKQESIACAKREGNIVLAESTALEIINSQFGRAVAVQTVASNKGSRSPGLSEESFRTNNDYISMMARLEEITTNPHKYKATPLSRVYIPKRDGSRRPLSIPSYTDRCLQALYKLAIEPMAEEVADVSSYGFRPMRSVSWAVGRVLNGLNNPFANYQCVVEIDIKGCFDNIDHEFISQVTPFIPKTILWAWLKCGYLELDSDQLQPTTSGVPQGGIISPLIMNLTLDGLEFHIHKRIQQSTSKSKGCTYCRYADDMVILTTSQETAQTALEAVKEFLAVRKLEVKLAKTAIKDIINDRNGFEFLSFRFRKVYRRNRKRLTSQVGIPTSAIRNFRNKIKTIAKSNKSLHTIIDEMNAVIRGWGYYYRFAHTSGYVFSSLGYWLWKQFYKLCYKRTKNRLDKANHTKINEVVLSTYFKPIGSGLSTKPFVLDKQGKPHSLFSIRSIEYCAPTFTNSVRNAFIFEDSVAITKVNLRAKSSWKRVILEKWGPCCGLCRKNLEINSIQYELHHILPKRFGGKDTPNNMVPLCKSPCHQLVSSSIQKSNVSEIKKYINLGILEVPSDYLDNLQSSPSSY